MERKPLNIYLAGPYSAPTLAEREANVARAVRLAVEVMRRGHRAHCPHAATHPLELLAPGEFPYERWMELDFSIIARWADAVYWYADSPGAAREAVLATRNDLLVFTDLEDIPDLRRAARCG